MDSNVAHFQVRLLPLYESDELKVDFSTFSLPCNTKFDNLTSLLQESLKSKNSNFGERLFDYYFNGQKIETISIGDAVKNFNIETENVIEIHYNPKIDSLTKEKSLKHSGWIKSIDCHRKIVITGCYDKMVYVWKSGKGKLVPSKLDFHKNFVTAVALVSGEDSQEMNHIKFLSGGEDSQIYLCEFDLLAQHPRIISSYHGHSSSIKCLSVSHDHKKFVSCSLDRTLKLWSLSCFDVNDTESSSIFRAVPVVTLASHTGAVQCVVWDKENRIFSGSWDHSVKIWDAATFSLNHSYNIGIEVNWLSHSPRESFLCFAGAFDGSFHILDSRTEDDGHIVKSDAHRNQISSINVSPYVSNIFITCGYDRRCYMWDMRNLKDPLHLVSLKDGRIMCSAWKDHVIYLGGDDELLTRISTKTMD